MKVLVQFISRSVTGSVERRAKIFDGEVITLGRATDQMIQLRDPRVGLEHARIARRGRRYSIYTKAIGGLTVNDRSCRDSPLRVDDVVKVGSNILRVIEPPDGVDFAFSFELDPEARIDQVEATPYRMSLAETVLRKRRWSWIFVVAILAGLLVIPLAVIYPNPVTGWVAALPMPGWLRDVPLPDDQVWDSGPLYRAHTAQIGDDCRQCHSAPFKMVRDEQCLACHQAVAHHVDRVAFALPELEARRCANCHKEHHGAESVVRRDQSLCSNCHADLQHHAADATLEDAADFGTHHPGFSLTTLVASDTGGSKWEWQAQRLPQSSEALREQSNLKFTHKAHLDPEGVKAPDGQVVMVCSDCHQLQAGGRLMASINMEQHCESCHQLSFDENQPDRQLPHGDANAIVRTLEEYYSYQFLTGSTQDQEQARESRRPGRTMTQEQQAQAIELAAVQAETTAAEIFENRLCFNCHEIDATQDSEQRSRWQVRPVQLTEHWMPKARFDHSRHRISKCEDCHAAVDSESSADVLLPDIDNCRTCHGGATSAAGQLASTCVDCHDFHIERFGPMREASAGQ